MFGYWKLFLSHKLLVSLSKLLPVSHFLSKYFNPLYQTFLCYENVSIHGGED